MTKQFAAPVKIKFWLLGLAAAGVLLLVLGPAKTAPDLALTTITGKQVALRQLRGKVTLVTFWATDCPSCLAEIPDLIDLYRRYHERGLEIIAIAMNYDPPSRVVALSKNQSIPYDVVLDLKSDYAQAFGQVRLTPSTFLIDAKGALAAEQTGQFEPEAMKAKISQLLKG